MTTLSIDIETYSDVDIRSCGAYRYVDTDAFEVLLFAYSINGGEVELIDLACGEAIPQEIEDLVFDPDVLKTAYNAAFERTCLGKHFGRPCEPEQWECSLVLGAQLGLPMHLQGISEALNLASEAKDTAGKALIRYFCIPCKPTKVNGGRTRNYPHHDIEKWELFRGYCKQDVVAENAVRRRLLKYKPNEEEKRFWDLDQKINDNGVRVDLDLVESAIAIDAVNKAWLTEESIRISGIENPNSVSQIKEWLKKTEGCDIQSLNKKAMPEVVQQLKNEVSHKFLALRSELSKSSTKKYEAIERSVCSDDHVRGVFQFYGANRTGRFAGRLVQLQNLPQNHMPDLAEARDVVKAGEHGVVKAIYDNVTSTLSELIRTAFIPEPGCRFIVADFSAIEARVIAWMANEAWVLEVFNGDGKIYEATASQMFHVPKESISKGSDLRAKGKVAQLACGYGGGPPAMVAMGALQSGIEEEELPKLVKQWRNANPHICRWWGSLENAALDAVASQSSVLERTSGVVFKYEAGMLFVKLPSGRNLCYQNPKLVDGKFGKKALSYLGVNAQKQWGYIDTWGGKIAENIVQATARDCLRDVMLKLDERGFDIRMHVHDEVVLSVPYGESSVEELCNIMGEELPWAKGLPLRAAGYETPYYLKD